MRYLLFFISNQVSLKFEYEHHDNILFKHVKMCNVNRLAQYKHIKDPYWGSGWKGPNVACQIKKTVMLHVSVTGKIAVSPVTNETYPGLMSL